MTGAEGKERLFPELDGEEESTITELESMCMYCHKEGTTRLMLTLIPHFREVILSSFTCDHCGFEDCHIQSGSRIQEKAVNYVVTIKSPQDLNRQVVKGEEAVFRLPELDFEQPASKRGEVSTVEGLLDSVVSGLERQQPQRKIEHPDTAAKIDTFIQKLTKLKTLEKPFPMVIDDPTGNSYVENLQAPQSDPQITITHYVRSSEQDIELGLKSEEPKKEAATETEEMREEINGEKAEIVEDDKEDSLNDQVLGFATNCPECNSPCETNMKMVKIPFFKDTIIMATVCEVCGLKDNEVKSGTAIEDKGTRIKLKVTDTSDLSRDILKSDTCGVIIPEVDLEMMEGTLGGKFTTLEGLLTNIKDQLTRSNPFMTGDSSDEKQLQKMTAFCKKLEQMLCGEVLDYHIILDDPAGNSYLQNFYAPDSDPEMEITHYERNWEQNESLGLNDMKVENYSQDS